MVKKTRLKEFGSKATKVVMAAATHPTTFGLLIMAVATAGQLINGNPSSKDTRRLEVRGQLKGLYDGSQAVAIASALAPVAVGALSTVSAGIKAVSKQPT